MNLTSIQKNNPDRYKRIIEIERQTADYKNRKLLGKTFSHQIITIPVVVHVLHNGQSVGSGLNISNAQIQSQIDVLNEDFRRLNADASNTPSTFQGVAADTEFEFVLACTDPNGNPTNGIVRVQTNENDFTYVRNADRTANEVAIGIKFAPTGTPSWPTDRYLNIWVCNLTDGLLGYGQFPDEFATKPNTDGVVVHTTAFGRVGNLQARFDKGRTATHEIGHWLNLQHIWGDDFGACTGTDEVADTPNQGNSYGGQCPTGNRTSCGSNDMYMNYMDYTDDACMNLFSNGQATRMQALFQPGGVRESFVDCDFISQVCISTPILIGPSLVCTSNRTFTLNNVPTGATVSWSLSSNLTLVSSNNSSATVRAATISSNGNGWLRATISSNCGSFNVQNNFWVGTPGGVSTSPSGVPAIEAVIGQTFNVYATSTPGSSPSSLSWWVNDNNALSLSGNGSGMATIEAFGPAGNYFLYVRGNNSCGQGIFTQIPININGGGGGIHPMFAMRYSPNPVTETLTVEIEPREEQADQFYEYSVSLYNKNGKLMYNQKSTDLCHKIDMRPLQKGLYRLFVEAGEDQYEANIYKQ